MNQALQGNYRGKINPETLVIKAGQIINLKNHERTI